MARKSSRRRRPRRRGGRWGAVVVLGLALTLVTVFAGSALWKALGRVRLPAVGWRAAAPAAPAPLAGRALAARAVVAVEVWNGSGNAGAGQRVAGALRGGGFRVTDVCKADRSDYGTTLVLDRRGDPRAAQEVVEYLHGGYPLRMRSPLATADVRVVVGRDHRGLRLAP